MTEKVQLTYSEYKKACDAGASFGNGGCACVGRQGNDEFCRCRMKVLYVIIPEEREILAQEFRDIDKQYAEEDEKRWQEYLEKERKTNPPKPPGSFAAFDKIASS